MYIDPLLGAPLLEPLLRLQASSNYTTEYAAADLGAVPHKHENWDMVFRSSAVGSNYPSVSGRISSHSQGVERLYF